MKHGMVDSKSSYKMTVLRRNARFENGGYLHIGEATTYRFDGYKESIIEFLVKPENINREIRFQKNTSVDEYGTGFSDCNLHVLISELVSGPTTPGGAIIEAVRQAAGGIAGGVITGAIGALGAIGNTIVTIYEIGSGIDQIVSTQFDIKAKATSLAAKQMYKNKLTRQIHHKFNSRIAVALRGRVNASLERAHKVIDTGSTSITCGALAVLIDERA